MNFPQTLFGKDIPEFGNPVLEDGESIVFHLHVFCLGPPQPRQFPVCFEERHGIALYLADLTHAEVFSALEQLDATPLRSECHSTLYIC